MNVGVGGMVTAAALRGTVPHRAKIVLSARETTLKKVFSILKSPIYPDVVIVHPDRFC